MSIKEQSRELDQHKLCVSLPKNRIRLTHLLYSNRANSHVFQHTLLVYYRNSSGKAVKPEEMLQINVTLKSYNKYQN